MTLWLAFVIGLVLGGLITAWGLSLAVVIRTSANGRTAGPPA